MAFTKIAVENLGGSVLPAVSGTSLTNLPTKNTPCFGAKATSNQTGVGSGAWTKVQFDTEYFDVGSGYDATNDKFVVPSGEAGKYFFSASAKINPATSG